MNDKYLLEVKNLEIDFPSKKANKRNRNRKVDLNKEITESVVKRISFSVKEGEIIGIVGESGSGKTMTALSIIGLLPKQARIKQGSILFEEKELLYLSDKQLRELKGNGISMIFQEPMSSLNPLLRVGSQVDEMLGNHSELRQEEIKEATIQMFKEVGLENALDIYEKYPHQLSGGMRQRVMIAMAMICNPRIMIADEPTTALDVTVQAQILKLIKKLNKDYGTSVILISHDLGVIKSICERVFVMRDGRVVEEGYVEELFYQPKQEYTRQLIHAVPSIYNRKHKRKITVSTNELHQENRIESDKQPILKVEHVDAYYEEKQQKLFAKSKKKSILHDVSFEIQRGEIMGIVGESGCGKSTLAKVIVGLHEGITGKVHLDGTNPQMVFQDSYGSLNPAKKVEWILEEPMRIKGGYTRKQRKEAVYDRLEQVGLKKEYANRYMNELSGGQRQRVSIANSIMLKPEFIILDEPVSALDVTVQAQILDLLLDLRQKYNLTYLFISHDLNVIGQICDRVCVMHEGKIVEIAFVEELYHNPTHPYSKKLLGAIPTFNPWNSLA